MSSEVAVKLREVETSLTDASEDLSRDPRIAPDVRATAAANIGAALTSVRAALKAVDGDAEGAGGKEYAYKSLGDLFGVCAGEISLSYEEIIAAKYTYDWDNE